MKLLKIWGLAVCTMFTSVSAMADEAVNFDLNQPGFRRCERFSFNPRVCERTPGCRFDFRFRRCVSEVRPPFSRCDRFSFSPRACERTPGCSYDWRLRKCVGGHFGPF